MRIDRDAAPVVADRQMVARAQRHLDPRGMARHRLVHAVVEHLGGQVMQRALVGAADIHARPAPHGFQPLEHLDRGGVIGFGRGGGFGEQIVGHAASYTAEMLGRASGPPDLSARMFRL